MIDLRNITKSFGGLKAVSNVSLQLREGEIMGLIGPNGAGKTTLVNLVSGMDTPSSGKLLFQGMDITHKSAHQKCALGIARTFQNIRLFGDMNVMDNILAGRHLKIPGALRRMGWLFPWNRRKLNDQKAFCTDCLQTMGIDHHMDKAARTLSYGDQRRVELARALATEPLFLLLDEPAAGMNPQETQEMGLHILNLKKKGITIMVIEHDMNLIYRVCDRVAVLNFGSLIAMDSPKEVQNDPRVIEAYLGGE